VARPTLQDPNFRQTVVLLLEHNAGGALGLVVNRAAEIEELPFPVFAGGPCPSEGLLMLHGHAEWVKAQPGPVSTGVAPGIYLGDASCLERANAAPADKKVQYRVFSGYAGWGPAQLESELAGGDWTLIPATGPVLFGTPPEELWERLVPPRIPQPSMN
jgi:putative transcriptional regulator